MECDVVIIDTGINLSHPEIIKKKDSIKFYFKFEKSKGNIIVKSDEFNDEIGHGTNIFHMISKELDNVTYCIIKLDILYEDTDEEILLNCFDFIEKNIKCKLINFSGGILECSDKEKFEKICDKLYEKGTFILASFSNDGILSYPALFKNVLGIDFDENITKCSEWVFVKNSYVNIKGYSGPFLLASLENTFEYVAGASYITAWFSKEIMKRIQKGDNREKIYQYLEDHASNKITVKNYKEPKVPFDIKSAIVFPYNKENYILCGFQKLLNFDLIGIYDVKYSKNIGKGINDINPYYIGYNSNLTIQELSEIDWHSNFDTVILGHITKMSKIIKIDYLDYFIKKCIKYHKNIYSYDPVPENYIQQMKQNNLYCYFPSIENSNIYERNLGKLFSHSVPVVGVFGTSSKQGKYSISLKLIDEFKKNKYNIGYLGTEPNSYFFSNKYNFPIGYNSIFTNDQRELISIANYYLHKIDNAVDIILITSQSNTVSSCTGGFSVLPIEQSSLIIGCAPQAYVLCINPWDSFEYIERTIKYLTSYYTACVVCIVIYVTNKFDVWDNIKGVNLKNDFDYYEFANKISNYFKISTYLSNEEELANKIFNEIVDYF